MKTPAALSGGWLAICWLAVSLNAGEVITCKSPNGKFALRHVYGDQQPYIGDTAIIEVATHKTLVALASNREFWTLTLLWSNDSQRVAYFDEKAQIQTTRVFFLTGSSFNEIKFPELSSPNLPPAAATAEPGAETKARVEPIEWLKSGDLVLESELLNPVWGRAASRITLGFNQENRCSVHKVEQEKMSIIDYFLLLPTDQFEGPPSVWLRHARTGGGNLYLCDSGPREKYVDEKNGYMMCPGDGAQPSFEVALFRRRDGRPLLALCSGELEGADSVDLRFFEMSDDNKMHEIKHSMFPGTEREYDPDLGEGKGKWQFVLPRQGRTIVVRAQKSKKTLRRVTWDGETFQEEK